MISWHKSMDTIIRCAGTTRKGDRCLKRVHREGCFCYIHDTGDQSTKDVKQCTAITSTGKQCTVNPWGGYYCGLHTPIPEPDKSIIMIEAGNILGFFDSYVKAEESSSNLQSELKEAHVRITYRLINQPSREIKKWNQMKVYYSETMLNEGMSSMKVKNMIDLINEFMGKGHIWYMVRARNLPVCPCTLSYAETKREEKKIKAKYYIIELNTFAKRGEGPPRAQ